MQNAQNRIPSAPEPFSPASRLRAVVSEPSARNSSVVAGTLWMLGVSLALFFVPLLNGLIAGLVGGYKVGSMRRALISALLPAAVAGAGLWAIFALLGAPVFGLLAAPGVAVMIAMSELGLFVGAAIGGYAAERPRSTD